MTSGLTRPLVFLFGLFFCWRFATCLAGTGAKGKTRQNVIGDLTVVWGALERTRDGPDNPWPLVRPEANDGERGRPFAREQETETLKRRFDFTEGHVVISNIRMSLKRAAFPNPCYGHV
ncbi:MAG: hypothetical protein BWY57_02773 [Betaproteobacteria bacterium ADurb.Bin341]|nr:MAG: hypothetical protein BWY57_02773 [Betaproteobacteria bacterium ADurb.Bin341]